MGVVSELRRDPLLAGKKIIIVGATGGVGSAIARFFHREGARLLLAGRNREKLEGLAQELGEGHLVQVLDLGKPESITSFAETVGESFAEADWLVNAVGMDIRRPLAAHDAEEIDRILNINLKGAILLTQAILPRMNPAHGIITHIGGFADGRLAFPYHTVDVATRAGLFSFIEGMNRELRLEGKGQRVAFFSPSPTETESERPYHPLWRRMGIRIVPLEKVAYELLHSLVRQKRVHIMGGWATRLFAKINAAWPGMADRIAMNGIGRQLTVLSEENSAENGSKKKRRFSTAQKCGLILVVLSFILYGGLFLVPFLKADLKVKAVITTALIATGEASFWIGSLILGKSIVAKIRKSMNPCTWFCRRSEG